MIKNVVFDIGLVLLGFDVKKYLLSLFDEETAMRVAKAVFLSGYWHEIDRAVLSEDELLDLFFSADPGVKEEIRTAYDRIGECVERRSWPIQVIDGLREQGYKVYYLSNMSEHVISKGQHAFDFVSHMDGGIFSCHVKAIKPDPEIYRRLFDKYGLVPEECIFIDDQPANIAMARKLGMKGIRFENYGQMQADLDKALVKDRGHSRISVLCYGDSNTYGYDPYTGSRYPYEKRWTTILGEMLGDRYEVIPEGLNGRTTAYDRPGALWKNGITSFTACLGTHKPVDYLIIMLGTNDCNAGLGLSAEQIAGGMENLVKIAEKETPGLQGYIPEIIVTAPAAIQGDYENSPFAYELTPESVQKSHDIGPMYEELAKKHGMRFADATTGIEVSEDCEHLTEEGHRQMAKLLYDAILARP
jgi:putative hydrolase of the HAD superfamily